MGYCARMTRIKAVVAETESPGCLARKNDYSRLGSGSVKRAGKRDGLMIPFEQTIKSKKAFRRDLCNLCQAQLSRPRL